MDTDKESAGRPGTRRSPGGYVVENSLAHVGFDNIDRLVALVETARPKWRPFDVVICQNAWNFIPRHEFRDLLRTYPTTSRLRYRARRWVAGLNVRRAKRIVVLSRYMQDLLSSTAASVETVPIDGPADLPSVVPRRPVGLKDTADLWLIPGTLTWYKCPQYAVSLAAVAKKLGHEPFLVFAGGDDGSGCERATEHALYTSGVQGRIGPASRAEMVWLLNNARVTVIPSLLESLSLSFAEALVLSPCVLARRLPVHLELARRIGREASWIPESPEADLAHLVHDIYDRAAVPLRETSDEQFISGWRDLRTALCDG